MTASTRSRWLIPLIAGLVVVAAVIAALALRRDATSPATPAGTVTTGTTPSATATSPTSSGTAGTPTTGTTATGAPTGGAVTTVPVYYLADVPRFGPKLYREFHRTPLLNRDPILTALTQMFKDQPADPDYSSLWPTATRVLSVSKSGSTATVDLSGFLSLGAAFESASVQQLVHTVTAADPTVRTVRLRVNGSAPPSGHSDWSAPIARAKALDVQANVWLLAPGQGSSVTSPVVVKVLGTGWEGFVPLKVYRGEVLVAEGAVTTMMGGFAQAQKTFTLAAGTYEIRAYNDNGADDRLDLWDTKTFTVR